jgi:alpha-beta hydrolase superfamily lysophospholipase
MVFAARSPSVDQMVANWGHRMIAAGIDYNDFMTTLPRVKVYWEDWCREWCATAAIHEKLAQEHEARGAAISAAEASFQAALGYHYACLHFIWDQKQYVLAHNKRVALYTKAAPYLDPPAERHEVPFGGLRMPAYLRRPNVPSRAPVVVFVSGTDSTKEEHHSMENVFLRRGLATFSFDGPGQGETWFKAAMPVDFERSTSAVIDYLQTLASVDATRVGLYGQSLGGYLATRSAAHDQRIGGCIASGGSYDRSFMLPHLEDPSQRGRHEQLYKVTDWEALARIIRASTMEGMAQKIHCPLMIVHGTRDFVPLEHSQRLVREASGPTELLVLEGGRHCSTNLAYRWRPQAGDFMVHCLSTG